MLTLARPLSAALAVSALFASSASAAPTLGTSVSVSDQPGRITQGPDNNIWVLLGGANEIAKITPAGVKTEYNSPNLAGATGLTSGPDGALWATKGGAVVKVSTANPADTGFTAIAEIVSAQDIVTGPDGNLWTASDNDVIKIPPAAPGSYQVFSNVLGAGGSARGIASGGDGHLWIVDNLEDQVERITTAGVATTPFTVGPGLQDVTAGPGTQVGVTQPNAADTNLARISPGGPVRKTRIGNGTDPFGITFGSDGAYWVAQFAMGTDSLGRLTPSGQYTEPIEFPPNSGPRRITRGPGNTLWVSLQGTNKVAVVRGVDPPRPAGVGPTGDRVGPAITRLRLSRKRFAVGKKRTPVDAAAKRVKRGTTIRFTLSEAGTVRIRFDRKLKGRRNAGRCVRPRRTLRNKRRCTRYKRAGKSLVRTGKKGRNSVAFSGRIGRKALPRGRYRLTIVARDAAGNRSKPKRASFRIVRAKKKRSRR